MGDIIGAIIGTSSQQTQRTVPDPISQQLSMARLNQLANFFAPNQPLSQYSFPNYDISTPTNFTTDLRNIGWNEALSPRTNLDYIPTLNFGDYLRSFDPVTQNYERALADIQRQTQGAQVSNVDDYYALRGLSDTQRDAALSRSYGGYNIGTGTAENAYGNVTASLDTAYNNAINRGDYDRARSIQQAQFDYSRASQRGDYDTMQAIEAAQSDYSRAAQTAGAYQQFAGAGNFANLQQALALQGLGRDQALALQGLSRDRALGLQGLSRDQALGALASTQSRSLGSLEFDRWRSLASQEGARQRALDLGTGAVGNYIDRIATPRLNQALALQGLESGGAVPTAIARATAEQAIPYLQNIEQLYGTNTANLLGQYGGNLAQLLGQYGGNEAQLLGQYGGNEAQLLRQYGENEAQLLGQYGGNQAQLLGQYGQLQGALGQAGMTTQADLANALMSLTGQTNLQNMTAQQQAAQQLAAASAAATQQAQSANAALGQQRLQTQGIVGNTYQNNITQLAQALMSNNITIEQAGIAANSALGQQLQQAQQQLRLQQTEAGVSLANTYNPLAASFTQSLPAAAMQTGMTPFALQRLKLENMNALAPLADYPRLLSEADYLRRQGLATSVYTGIPFSPGTTTKQTSSTGNLFDQLGGTLTSGFTNSVPQAAL